MPAVRSCRRGWPEANRRGHAAGFHRCRASDYCRVDRILAGRAHDPRGRTGRNPSEGGDGSRRRNFETRWIDDAQNRVGWAGFHQITRVVPSLGYDTCKLCPDDVRAAMVFAAPLALGLRQGGVRLAQLAFGILYFLVIRMSARPFMRSIRTLSPVFNRARPPPAAASGEALRIEGDPEVPDCRPSPTQGRAMMPFLIR